MNNVGILTDCKVYWVIKKTDQSGSEYTCVQIAESGPAAEMQIQVETAQ